MPNPKNVGRSPLLFEGDGDFNPGWALILACVVFGFVLILAGVVLSGGGMATAAAAASGLTFLVVVILVSAISVFKLAKAKLVSPALTRAAGAVGAVGTGMAEAAAAEVSAIGADLPTDDERGDPA